MLTRDIFCNHYLFEWLETLRCSLASWIVPLLPAVVWWCCMNLSVLCTEHFQPAQSSSDLCYWHQKGDEFTFLTHSSLAKKKKSFTVLNVSLAKSVTIWENIWTGRCKCKTPDGAQCVLLLVRVCIYLSIYIHTYICVCIYVYIYVYVCVVWFFLNKTFYTWYLLSFPAGQCSQCVTSATRGRYTTTRPFKKRPAYKMATFGFRGKDEMNFISQ